MPEPMTLVEAFRVLRGEVEGDRDGAFILLFKRTRTLAPKVWDKPTRAEVEDVSMESMTTLIRALERDMVPHDLTEAQLGGYVRTAVYRAFVNADRVARRAASLDTETLAAPVLEEEAEAPTEILARILKVLGRVIEAACDGHPRATGVRHSADELIALARRSTDTTKLVLQGHPELELDSVEFRRKRDALFKRHERTRERLTATTHAMLKAEKLNEGEHELAVKAIRGWLKRRRTGDSE